MASEFNLIEEAWIPSLDLQGKPVVYGIRDTLLKAHELREICDDSPLVVVALYRMLLALLYRAYQGPANLKEWKVIYALGKFPPDNKIDEYLKKWNERFFLFDSKYPFMQTAGLDLNEYKPDGSIKTDKSDGMTRLAREAPDKSGKLLFDHRNAEERLLYESGKIAGMLLAAQSFSGTGVASAGRINGKDIKPTPCQFAIEKQGILLWMQGENLFQTLLFNLAPRVVKEEDKPAWEDDEIVKKAIKSWPKGKEAPFSGHCQQFAPLSRCIFLIDRGSLFFTNGFKTSFDVQDPMLTYIKKDAKVAPVTLDKDKAAWRDAQAFLAADKENIQTAASINHVARLAEEEIISDLNHPIINVVGLATMQGKCNLWRHERMSVPLALISSKSLKERLAMLLKQADRAAWILSHGLVSFTGGATRKDSVGRIECIADFFLNPNMVEKSLGVIMTPDKKQPSQAHNTEVLNLCRKIHPCPVFWARMEQHFYTLLNDLPNDWDKEKDDWKPEEEQLATMAWCEKIKGEAKQALRESIRSLGTTARAIQAAARIKTDFTDSDLNPKEYPKPEDNKKKGGK